MDRRRRIRVACITALVMGLHLTALWYLLANSRVILRHPESRGFEMVLIPPPPAAPERALAMHSNERGSPRALPRRTSAASGTSSQPQPPQKSDAIQATIDWAGELAQVARNATEDKAGQAAKDFGFPRRPAAPGKAPQFDWDYAATHRVESLEGGGTLINLNDHCVLLLFPLPFFACGVGNKAPNGELLKHMSDPKDADPAPVP